jgi:UDP-N-acetylmuramoyl-tripeptide--D-alanyl-D-alanine ligase
MKLSRMAAVLNTSLIGADREISSFSSDTRSIQPGDMFIALSGENFDANNFLPQAVEKGAVAALVSRANPAVSLPQIVVPDTFVALGQLAQAWRQQYQSLVRVAITGSAGKTTTKELTASIFREMGETLATLGNKNNEIGVPLTLLRLQAGHRYGVFELGANHKGEIAYTSGLVQPQAAVIVNVGTAHLEGFGSRQGIAEAKAEIYDGLVEGGTAIINLDDDFAGYWQQRLAGKKQMTLSVQRAADVWADNIRQGKNRGYAFTLHAGGASADVELQLLGRHSVGNAVAAAALAHACGVPLEKIRTGLENTRPVSGRMILHVVGDQRFVIDDTYNANPASMKAAIDMLAEMPGRRVLVTGDMGELGSATESGHREVGGYAKMKKIDALYSVGQYSGFTAEAYGAGAQVSQNQQALIEELEKELEGVVTILVKGSRSARMENVVNALTKKNEEQH